MKKLIALIKTKGKSKKQITEEAKAILKRKGLLDKNGKPHIESKKQDNGK